MQVHHSVFLLFIELYLVVVVAGQTGFDLITSVPDVENTFVFELKTQFKSSEKTKQEKITGLHTDARGYHTHSRTHLHAPSYTHTSHTIICFTTHLRFCVLIIGS